MEEKVSNSTNSWNIKYYKDVQPKEVKWLWYPYIPFGKITIVQGDPGEGKSTFVINLCSMLTNGASIPFLKTKLDIGNVVYQNNEDGKADTIVPRLLSCGADLARIAYIDEENNYVDIASKDFEKTIENIDAKLIVLDPIQAYLGNNTDMNRSGDIRPIMKRLSMLAEKKGCAIVLIGHMSKNNNTKGLYRGLGSIDILAVARSVLLISRYKNDNQRIMAQVKNNLAPLGDSVVFSIDSHSKITWLNRTKITASQVLDNDFSEKIGKTDRAVSIILKKLENGPCLATEIENTCCQEGISLRTLKIAKSRLDIISKKTVDGWLWELCQ